MPSMFGANVYDENQNAKNNSPDGSWEKGEKQPAAFKDVGFAIAFILHFVAILAVVFVYGIDALNEQSKVSDNTNQDSNVDYSGAVKVVVAAGAVSLIFSALMLQVMIKFASILIKLSLLFSVAMAGVFVVISFMYGQLIGVVFGILFFAISVCYAYCVWNRIPFATANLVTALTAVKANFGITIAGYFFSIAGFGWTVLWSVALLGIYSVSPDICDGVDANGDECGKKLNYGYFFLLLVSFYWTHQVFTNTIHVSTAGMVGTWWFVPEEASGCCSSAVTSSVCRSCTYSFGSICFGSLIVAIIRAVRALLEEAKNNDQINGILVCVIDCLLSIIQGLVEYFNQWAYVYVGLYGYGYMEAGKNVMTLFRQRGWDAIIVDDLVDNCLFLVALMLGCLMGSFGLVMEATTEWFDGFVTGNVSLGLVAFLLCFLVGLIVGSITLSIVGSAVNATVVLFAEAPAEFSSNYPTLSSQMNEAYVKAYPDLF